MWLHTQSSVNIMSYVYISNLKFKHITILESSKKYILFKDGRPNITNLYETTMFSNINI